MNNLARQYHEERLAEMLLAVKRAEKKCEQNLPEHCLKLNEIDVYFLLGFVHRTKCIANANLESLLLSNKMWHLFAVKSCTRSRDTPFRLEAAKVGVVRKLRGYSSYRYRQFSAITPLFPSVLTISSLFARIS